MFSNVGSLSCDLNMLHVLSVPPVCVYWNLSSSYYIVLQIANYQREVDPCIEELSNIKLEEEVLQWCAEYFTSFCNKKQTLQPGRRKRRDRWFHDLGLDAIVPCEIENGIYIAATFHIFVSDDFMLPQIWLCCNFWRGLAFCLFVCLFFFQRWTVFLDKPYHVGIKYFVAQKGFIDRKNI